MLERSRVEEGMLLTLKGMNAPTSSGNTLGSHVSMSYFSCPPTPKINIHPYFHEYYSVETFIASYATPIPALTGQSH
jgi:hypothetical protein